MLKLSHQIVLMAHFWMVSLDMDRHVGLCSKSLAAVLALERFNVQVNELMSLQIVLILEFFTAHFAFPTLFPTTFVLFLFVLLEMSFLFESFTTGFARK